MTATVRSAQIPKVGGELRLVDLPPVEAGPEQVRVSVEACGICHSDDKNISSQGATVSAGEAISPGAGDGVDAPRRSAPRFLLRAGLRHQRRPARRGDQAQRSQRRRTARGGFEILGDRRDPTGLQLMRRTTQPLKQPNDHGLYDDFGGVATEREEGARIGKALGAYKAVLLANHGILTIGQTVAEAAGWFITMERSCQAQLLAMAAGEPKLIDHETATAVHHQTGHQLAGWFQLRPMHAEILAEQPDLLD